MEGLGAAWGSARVPLHPRDIPVLLPTREGRGARAASIPTPSHGDPALDLVRPLGATVIQIMNNYNDIKLVNDRYSASPAHNNTCKTPS